MGRTGTGQEDREMVRSFPHSRAGQLVASGALLLGLACGSSAKQQGGGAAGASGAGGEGVGGAEGGSARAQGGVGGEPVAEAGSSGSLPASVGAGGAGGTARASAGAGGAGGSGCPPDTILDDSGECIPVDAMTKYRASEIVETVDWVSGRSITVEGIYGDITVDVGLAGEVQVVIEPFQYAASDADADEAETEAAAQLTHSVDLLERGDVYISTGRNAGGNAVGADLTVQLPPEFDGVLDIHNRSDGVINPGDIDVQFVGPATAVSLVADALGDCTVWGNTTVTSTKADCEGQITIRGVSDVVNAMARGLQTGTAIDVSIARISDEAHDSQLTAEDGDVELTLPASADFMVQASTQDQGVVDLGELPRDDCTSSDSDPRSKTVRCGSGEELGTYQITAGTDCLGECDVAISYR